MSEQNRGASSVDLVASASRGAAPAIERMPRASIRARVAMRDGARLDTWVWLPFDRAGPVPAILLRTPYQEQVMGWARLRTLAYRDAGYAVVFQLVRGVGGSDGQFVLSDPLDKPDGHDAVEWVAAQPWCDGAIGMDGSSYVAMTQIAAASMQPPHLRCIIPAVPSASFFDHVGRFGGIFSRQHSIGWTQFVQVESLADLTPGLWGDAAFLASPSAWTRLTSRPAIAAADGTLFDDRLKHYRDILVHAIDDDWVKARVPQAADYARIEVPTLCVTGLYDASMGTQHVWHMLERHAPPGAERQLLIGPWDHGQSYVGGGDRHGPWDFGGYATFDLPTARLAFFDKHLKGNGEGAPLPGRVTAFVTGANRWLHAATYPHPDTVATPCYLASDGFANLRGHGWLTWEAPPAGASADHFRADPTLPFVPVAATLDPALILDLRERERMEDVLVYTSEPLAEPVTLHGEFTLELHLASDCPDGDIVAWLAEVPPDGSRTTMLSRGQLRLRYREGYEREVPLVPGEPTRAIIAMNHVGHRVAAHHRLRLLIGSDFFPTFDPNPNTGEPIATATELRVATQTIFHDTAHPSCLRLPVLREAAAA